MHHHLIILFQVILMLFVHAHATREHAFNIAIDTSFDDHLNSFLTKPGTIMMIHPEVRSGGFRAEYRNQMVKIKWQNNEPLSGKVDLISISGRTLLSTSFSNSVNKPLLLPVNKIPAGVYIVSVNAFDFKGNPIRFNKPVNIFK